MIAFCGLSHLGLVSGITLASQGFEVLGYDPDTNLTAKLQTGQLPVFETGLEKLLKDSHGRISFTSDLKMVSQCDLIYVSRDVPTDSNNNSNLQPIQALLAQIQEVAQPHATVVILCQVPPGFTRQTSATFRPDLKLIYQVETLIFGRAVERALLPERYIIGTPDPGKSLPEVLQKVLNVGKCPILPMRYESAELAKISINICLIAALTTANVISEVCEKIGADWREIEAALRLDKRIGQHSYIKPGLGIAGGNLERDLVSLNNMIAENGANQDVIKAWFHDLNYRRDWVLRTLQREVLSKIADPTLAIWGLAYKAGTHSIKNSPSLALIENLRGIKIRAFDPLVKLDSSEVLQVCDPVDTCKQADALVLMTPWEDFKQADLKTIKLEMRTATIIDPFRFLNEQQALTLGFKYYALGKPNV